MTPATATPPRDPVDQLQIELLRKAGLGARLDLAWSLSETAMELSRAGLRLRHPKLDEREIGLLFVAHHYGQDLARAVRERLANTVP